MPKKVSEIMSSHDVTIAKDESLLRAAQLMKQHDIGFLPVLENERVIGVVTDRDLVIRAMAEEKDMQFPITTVCSEKVVHIDSDESLQKAAEMMSQHQVRRLVVSKNGTLHGVITLADLAREERSDLAAGHALTGISRP
jgi:CBS domain-containing protein